MKLSALPLANDKKLFRGAKISNDEIVKIKHYLKNKIEDLPRAIVFCRSFLSFSKSKNVSDYFLGFSNKNKNLSKVLFILEKDDNLKYDLATHADIEKISYLPSEQEVLFFPFSSFEIKDIKEKELNKDEKIYEIYLFYLGKYLKHIESDEKIKMNENMISESEFKYKLLNLV